MAGTKLIDEDALEAAFWAFDEDSKRSGEERLAFKRQCRMLVGEALARAQPDSVKILVDALRKIGTIATTIGNNSSEDFERIAVSPKLHSRNSRERAMDKHPLAKFLGAWKGDDLQDMLALAKANRSIHTMAEEESGTVIKTMADAMFHCDSKAFNPTVDEYAEAAYRALCERAIIVRKP